MFPTASLFCILNIRFNIHGLIYRNLCVCHQTALFSETISWYLLGTFRQKKHTQSRETLGVGTKWDCKANASICCLVFASVPTPFPAANHGGCQMYSLPWTTYKERRQWEVVTITEVCHYSIYFLICLKLTLKIIQFSFITRLNFLSYKSMDFLLNSSTWDINHGNCKDQFFFFF